MAGVEALGRSSNLKASRGSQAQGTLTPWGNVRAAPTEISSEGAKTHGGWSWLTAGG
jgi:hypothetical protein